MPQEPVTVVSGLPRSGTSMMMRMVAAAGVPALSDGARPPDEDNPNGYFELEAVKRTREDPSWLEAAPGKAVKLVHILLKDLPDGYQYRLILMHRNLDEILASQRKMLERGGKKAAPPDALKRVYASQLRAIDEWLAGRMNFTRLDVDYNRMLQDPAGEARRVAEFLDRPGMHAAMTATVDSSLYRNRGTSA